MREQLWSRERSFAPSRSAPTPQRSEVGIHAFVWAIWPWMNWLLPLAAIFCVGNSGWGLIILVVASPVLVPIAGLLGSLPRFLLRRSGAAAPAPITTLLIVQWWAWVTAMVTPAGATDTTPIPAMMQQMSSRPISADYLNAVLAGASLTGALCGVAVLVLAIVSTRRAEGEPRAGATGWTWSAWLAIGLLPLLFMAVVWFGGVATDQQRDASGASVGEVQAQRFAVQVDVAGERYEQAQEQLSRVRGMIAVDGWRPSTRGLDTRTLTAEAVDSYGVDIVFERDPLADGVLDGLEDSLIEQGWTRGGDGAIVDPQGHVVEIFADENIVRVSLVSPTWWGDAYDLSDALGFYDDGFDDDYERTYAWDDWPGR